MRIPPIPRVMRQETISLRRMDDGGGYAQPVEVPRCRVDRAAGLAPNDWQLTQGCTARVLIDATEYGGDVAEGDLVVFDGESHAVASVKRIDHPDGTCHHWEIDAR